MYIGLGPKNRPSHIQEKGIQKFNSSLFKNRNQAFTTPHETKSGLYLESVAQNTTKAGQNNTNHGPNGPKWQKAIAAKQPFDVDFGVCSIFDGYLLRRPLCGLSPRVKKYFQRERPHSPPYGTNSRHYRIYLQAQRFVE